MGIDKLRLITTEIPQSTFLEAVNSDLQMPRKDRSFEVRFRNPAEGLVSAMSICRITTRRGVEPTFYLQLHFSAFAGDVSRQILELNPNKLRAGFLELMETIAWIFGSIPGDLKISRIDPCADIDLPVDFFLRCLRVPRKRKSAQYAKDDGHPLRAYGNRGVTGFTIGASPAMLRIYDKREELRRLREDVSGIPPILTRLEWELRHRKCPIARISEIDRLQEYRPFDQVEILTTTEVYDFHNDTKNSTRLFLLNRLTDEYSRQEAIRIVNYQRNFGRDYGAIVADDAEIKERLNESFRAGIQMFFENKGADVRYRYGIPGRS